MDQEDSHTHSFIIRIWIEELNDEGDQKAWRGHITHVPSGKRRYMKDFDDILAFILPYTELNNSNLSALLLRVNQWLKQHNLRLVKTS
jgi:hypothetical protein